jgi:hypothetical protein
LASLPSAATNKKRNGKTNSSEAAAGAHKQTLYEKKMIAETSDPNGIQLLRPLHGHASALPSSEQVTARIVAETMRGPPDDTQEELISQDQTSSDQGEALYL